MKKLSIMIFMAASMLAACDNNNDNRRATDTQNPGEPGYISTQGQGVDVRDVEIDRTSNNPNMAADEDTRIRRVMSQEQERLSYWTIEEDRINDDNPESIRASLDQMEQNFNRIEADIRNVETGTYNPQGQLSREGQSELNEAKEKLNEAKQKHREARQKLQANKHDDAADRLKKANSKLEDAREEYMEALEKETGVERDNSRL